MLPADSINLQWIKPLLYERVEKGGSNLTNRLICSWFLNKYLTILADLSLNIKD